MDVGEFNGRRLYTRLWAPTCASRAVSAVAELLVSCRALIVCGQIGACACALNKARFTDTRRAGAWCDVIDQLRCHRSAASIYRTRRTQIITASTYASTVASTVKPCLHCEIKRRDNSISRVTTSEIISASEKALKLFRNNFSDIERVRKCSWAATLSLWNYFETILPAEIIWK